MQRLESYKKPTKIEEAITYLAQEPQNKLLAGGTDLIIQLIEKSVSPPVLIDLGGIDSLKRLDVEEGNLVIGSTVTFSQLADDERVRTGWAALAEAAASVAAPQIRNRATIGGNVANAAVAADSVPALIVLNAEAELASDRGTRHVPVEDLMLGLNESGIEPDELLTCFKVPATQSRSAFEKIGRRKAQTIARINVAVALDESQGVVTKARIAVGAAGRFAYLCEEASAALVGNPLNDESIQAACQAINQKVADVLGTRPTAPYKRSIAAAALEDALFRLKGETEA